MVPMYVFQGVDGEYPLLLQCSHNAIEKAFEKKYSLPFFRKQLFGAFKCLSYSARVQV